MPLNEKKLISDENKKALNGFKLSTDKTKLELYMLSSWANRLFSRQKTTYHKKIIVINEKSQLLFIKKNKTPDGFIWHTSPDTLPIAIRYGLFKPGALTSDVIATLGQYRMVCLKRAHHHHTISPLTHDKLILVNHTQDLISAFFPLERTINGYHYGKSPEENLSYLINHYKSLVHKINKIDKKKHHFENHFLEEKIHLQHKKIIHSLNKQIERLSQKNTITIDLVKSLFAYHLNESAGFFIKSQLTEVVRNLQYLNQMLVYTKKNRAFNRGDLHALCLDANRLINDSVEDLHNPILKSHQGFFDKSQKVALDFSGEESKKSLMATRLMTISHIEKKDALIFKKNNDAYLQTPFKNKEFKLKKTPYIKWSHHFGIAYSILRFIIGSWNILIGLVFGLTVDLFFGLAAGILGYRFSSVSESLRISFNLTMENHSFYHQLSQELPNEQFSLGTLVGFKIGNFFKNVFVDFFYGVKASIGQYKIELWDNLKADYHLGHKKTANLSNTLNDLLQTFSSLNQEKKLCLSEILEKHYPDKYRCDLKNQSIPQAIFAKAPYQLNDGEWLDILNALTRGAKVFSDTFTYHLFYKNPTSGLMFSAAYLLGGFAVYCPEKMKFLPKFYIDFSRSIANTMSHGKLTSSIASASMQGQMAAGITEAIKNGQDSWFANAGLLFEKEPSNILVYATLAVGLGALLAYELEIPVLSEEIRNNMGSFPIPSLGFAGAKIGILVIDFIEPKKNVQKADTLDDLRKIILNELSLLDTNFEKSDKSKTLLLQKLSDEKLIHALNVAKNSVYHLKPLIEQSLLIYLLCEHKDDLVNLDFIKKREIIYLLRKANTLKSHEIETIKTLLFPNNKNSILFVTITTFFNYVPLLLRNLCMMITKDSEPFFDLKQKVTKDITRLIRVINKTAFVLSSTLKTLFLGMMDLIGNETLAKVDGKCFSSHYKMSEKLLVANCQIDKGISQIENTTSYLNQKLYQHSTPPTPFTLLQKLSQTLKGHAPKKETSINTQSFIKKGARP